MGIILLGSEASEVPNWFLRRLKGIDRALVVYWNPYRNFFCIDRCTRGNDCLSESHTECPKTNVTTFEHMSERVLDELKSKDAWAKFGGNDQAAFERSRREHEIAKEEFEAKRIEKAKEGYKEAALDNRKQMNEALMLIQRHDMHRVH